MNPIDEVEQRRESLKRSKEIQSDLDRRVFHLKTLSDVSKDIFGAKDFETILNNFLLMTTGNFGVIEGFILIQHVPSKEIAHFVSLGFKDNERASLSEGGRKFLMEWEREEAMVDGHKLEGLGILPPTVVCVLPFSVDEACTGLLGLGSKIVGDPYTNDDKELLVTLVNNLVVSLKNARSFDGIKRLNVDLHDKNVQLEEALNDLDRRVYHLKTLYDVSKDIFGSVDFETILKNFLLMAMGNFGVMEGFILTLDMPSGATTHFESMGYEESVLDSLREAARQHLMRGHADGSNQKGVALIEPINLAPHVVCALPFTVVSDCSGFMGLGPKLVSEPYSEDDKELLVTLVNNLVVSLKNARSFEDIRRLNEDLQAKNVELSTALKELQAAMRKVELLESIKANLSKFVPTTVTRLIEKSPTASIPEAREQDVSVLFLDIEGYTKMSERLSSTELNELIERYFSVFMDAIYDNNGDVNETAGDGLMVLFMNDDQKANAMEAVRTALTIREKAASINQENSAFAEPLVINMGINSGQALLGAAKFESFTGSRWTYTARGMVTNVAARIGALASEGAIHLSRPTADRVKEYFSISPVGKFTLKNVSEQVEVFTVKGQPPEPPPSPD
jgi:class 3 adenylate cyclase